ncbi:penicillin acylase family protein [Aquipseudomonas alcaligenes]|uniref:Acyl-homoserine lactone acylase QuiP n=1 Tax=Aquipseudomonas alcaligenes TaxID=43263 RepID=A0AA37FNL5_AQUAC|nr:penicillin acylase family protein [Pseudomonas alcaligenes]BCR25245.1 acyl-homoserine lactone acylase QuiP [Pseudomonas alcaligenes]GIZ67016.1 acyl-homoserine lactone acylase QuiP [Pseudomonas alcaligenes]GIZ71619.1 acyl-homoserine lactone acylase QuiP [Pseudomonas alcaligenes]GIZ75968.1 acyl-homoserine lactone acylase QuiP [Pseudomonas alcaligenes]GIZ79932.1 acyl-homoserine lactone acylase QuiP [Pseudomonas alcaligenes]
MGSRFLRLTILATLGSTLLLGGCQSFLNSRYADSVHPDQGIVRVQGLAQSVVVRRNPLGMPLIETTTFHDALFTLGYVHAADRLSQMVGMRLLAEGRLAEMNGPGMLEIDRFMRTVNLKAEAEVLYKNASPRIKKFFEVYARGVNAYLFRYQDRLPMDLAESGYRPAYWKPEDSVLLFCLLNFGLSVNLQEEIAALKLADKVGADKLAWLLPSYPDEPLPFEEAEKLRGLSLGGQIPGLAAVNDAAGQVAALNMLGVAASNNWAIAPQNSRSGKSLLANDTHLPLSMPSIWNFVHIRSPKFQAAGVSIAGVPAVVAGFNGKLAWGMTMVMGDNQDLFLEQLKREGGRLYYMADGKWQPARERQETFFIKGQRPIRETIWETRHGPLLNSALGERKSPLQPLPLRSGYGLALRNIQAEADRSIDAFFDLSRAQSVEQAFEATREVRAMALNMVFADAQHIGWQVTGRYPNRKQGTGLVPSPGWNGAYDWDGYADPMLHPYDQDPLQGWLGTANHRTVPRGYGMQLSNSWFYPERAERIAQLAGSGKHDQKSMIAMQYDQTTPFAGKLQAMLDAPSMAAPLKQAIAALPAPERTKAEEAYKRLMAFDGRMAATSADAALYSAFLQESAKATFLDELGPQTSPAWQALVDTANNSYSAQADHLLGRDDSPFWDDVKTAQKEDKAAILARSLANAVTFLEGKLGANRSAWQWGKLHQYRWTSNASKMAPYLSASQRSSIESIGSYLDRGPYPAGGDHGTLNVAAYAWGNDFDVWLIPAMRIVVDFGLPEPMIGLNSSGQSGNPASRHYADGIEAWLKGGYMSFPFQSGNIDRVYGNKRLMLMPGR